MTFTPDIRRAPSLLALIALALAVRPSAAAPQCPSPPLFDLSGPTCSSTKQNDACGCSECVLWDASTGATWYEIQRCLPGGACTIVGNTKWRNRPGTTARMWCAAWDTTFPVMGIAYDYRVRACRDGATGALCATSLSNAVRYVGAPYMCFQGGLEIPCAATAGPPGAVGDLDGDGTPDAVDLDDDEDGRADPVDNCPRHTNIGQRDADGDGIGDPCDASPWAASVDVAADADGDGVPDVLDSCATIADPLQADADADRVGDVCDNCAAQYNEHQTDSDGDGEGNRCDVDDTLLDVNWTSKVRIAWEPERGFTTWSAYRGDLAELRRSGTYTQATGTNPLAARWCGVAANEMYDSAIPAPGSAAFYLVAGRAGTLEGSLGTDGDGKNRVNTRMCP